MVAAGCRRKIVDSKQHKWFDVNVTTHIV